MNERTNIIISRPSEKERAYSPAVLKIYINNILVERLAKGDVKVISTTESSIQIFAKYNWYKSKKLTVEPGENRYIEININSKIKTHPLIILASASPMMTLALNQEKSLWLRIALCGVYAVIALWVMIKMISLREKWILIK